MPDIVKPVSWLNRKRQGARYGVTTRTIKRWEQDPEMDYPPGALIGGQWCRREDKLDAWDREREQITEAPGVREKAVRASAAAKAKRIAKAFKNAESSA